MIHGLTHARNLAASQALSAIADTDENAYADPASAVARSATDEMVARYVTWVVSQELAGNPG